MSRNQAGTYSLPEGNPVESGTLITSDWANTTLSDVAGALTASMARDGSTPFTGPVSLIDGTVTSPALRFTKDSRTGLYRKADGTIGFVSGGSIGLELTPTGAKIPSGKALDVTDLPVGPTNAVNKAYVDSRIGKSVLTVWEFVPALGQTIITGADLNGNALNYNAASALVTLNGTILQPGEDYLLTNANTVTLTAGTLYGDDVLLVMEIAGGVGPAGPQGPTGAPGVVELDGPPLTNYVFKATAGQTVFTGVDTLGQTLNFTSGSLLAFVNGAYAGFIETSANEVTLTTPAALDDEVVFVQVTRAGGLKGDKGDTGAPGATGPQGPAGAKGDTGAPSTIAGPKGDTGLTGDKGADGTSINIIGTLVSSADLPASGEKGDAYSITGNLWVWAGTEWVDVGPIQGPKGDTGATGPKGDTGPQGSAGTTGAAGPQGPQGPQGPAGTNVIDQATLDSILARLAALEAKTAPISNTGAGIYVEGHLLATNDVIAFRPK